MKQLKLIILALVGCIMLTACPSNGEIEEDVKGKEYVDSYNIPADGCDVTYNIKEFKTRISSVSSTPDWLTITPVPYTAGSPSITIKAKSNTGSQDRKCTIVIKDATDKITLTVIQTSQSSSGQTADDEYHNSVSHNPAYTKGR